MISWQKLAKRAAVGPWSEEEIGTLERLTQDNPAGKHRNEVVRFIKSATFPGFEENETMLVPDMSQAVWGERGTGLDLDSRMMFTQATLAAVRELEAATGVSSEEGDGNAVYSACLLFALSRPMLFPV